MTPVSHPDPAGTTHHGAPARPTVTSARQGGRCEAGWMIGACVYPVSASRRVSTWSGGKPSAVNMRSMAAGRPFRFMLFDLTASPSVVRLASSSSKTWVVVSSLTAGFLA